MNDLLPQQPYTYPQPYLHPDTYPHPRANIIRILVVDDSDVTRCMLCRVLISRGYECDEANDGNKAVEIMMKETITCRLDTDINKNLPSYDLILMDFIMPNLNGPDATRMIRELGYKGLIYGVTGNSLATDVAIFKSSGVDRVFIKPLDMNLFTTYFHGMYTYIFIILLIKAYIKSICIYIHLFLIRLYLLCYIIRITYTNVFIFPMYPM
jgi:CheY-like chemotaxis protein